MPVRRALIALFALCAGLLVGASFARADEERRLRVLTWNVGTLLPWSMRLPDRAIPRVVSVIAAARPDVVTLQEVRDPGQITLLRAGLAARGLRYRMTFAAVDPRHPDGLAVVLHLAARTDTPRIATRVGFVSPGVGLAGVTVLAVHAPTDAPADRASYVRDLLAWAAKRPGPLVLAGDWNLGPHGGCALAAVLPAQRAVDRSTYARLCAALGSRTSVGPTTTYRLAFDHVFVRGGRVTAARVVKGRRLFPMDHDPVVADVALAPATAMRTRPSPGLVGRLAP